MADKGEIIAMSSKELTRYEIIKELVDGKINGTDASLKLGLSIRQIKRLRKKVRDGGAKELIHGSRGKSGNRKINSEIIKKARELLKEKYPDFGPTLAQEKLEEINKIKIGTEKIRQMMIEEKLWKPRLKKKNGEHRQWRERKENFGEMEQFDGSYEDWFEGRSPVCCLLASIDDATGKISKAKFAKNEGVSCVFEFWKSYVKVNGKPLSVYLDRFSTYKQNMKSIADDPKALTQFERAMETDLSIKIIHAYSPQAKGRIERLFGTLQDRLIKEMRLKNICSVEEANKFLEEEFTPSFNKKFSVPARGKNNLHKKLNDFEKENLDKIFSVQNSRIVCNDFTIQYQRKYFQLLKDQPTLVLRKDKILISETIEKKIFISLREKNLNYKVLPERPQKEIKEKKVTALTREWKKPAENHPWRQYGLNRINCQRSKQQAAAT
jgi:hypothetical protein